MCFVDNRKRGRESTHTLYYRLVERNRVKVDVYIFEACLHAFHLLAVSGYGRN